MHYICNILVVNDPKHPENNGKVKLFRFGKKIFDKLSDKANPTFADEKAVNVFDPFAGADFKLRIREYEGYANYDKSEFASPSEMCDGDEEKMVEVLNARHSLKEFIAPDQFKSYDELKKRLNEVLGLTGGSTLTPAAEDNFEAPEPEVKATPAPKAQVSKPAPSASDEDDDMEFFKSLAGA